MIGDSVNGEPGAVHPEAAARPGGNRWTPRVLLLGPAMIQLVVAYVLYQDLRGGARVTPVLVSVMLLALGGAGGIVAGVFGRSRRLLQLGILSALLGFVLPAAIQAAAAPVDNSTSVVPFLGEFDAEGLGILLSPRMLVELPFWGLYAVVVIAGHLGSRRTENGTAASRISSGPGHR